jgi:hypothetical protein
VPHYPVSFAWLYRFARLLRARHKVRSRAKTNSLPEWRWEAVIAALEDPSIEVQQAAVEWLAALSEQRYAPPKARRLNDFVNCSKPVSSLRILQMVLCYASIALG